MRKIILIIGTLLILLNTVFGLIITNYSVFNFLLADASLLLSMVITYFTAHGKMANGFKIGLSVLFSFTGLIRYLCAVFASEVLANNVPLIIIVGLLFFEITCLGICLMVSEKVK